VIEKRVTGNEHGDPVVTLTVTGSHDVSRLLWIFGGGPPPVEWYDLARKIRRSLPTVVLSPRRACESCPRVSPSPTPEEPAGL
jgi:hypothetical protein